jgi:hypothetical protein
VTEAGAGLVPRVVSQLTGGDVFGTFKARWGIGRMRYTVVPGLYALGDPGPEDQVFVTANYKMSFDRLRAGLSGANAWILVLDTDGINVWCAAGHGTFGTDELVDKIRECRLNKVVSHRTIILPQLGAPGVAAHLVKKQSGFKVVWGPIRAEDIPTFLEGGLKATPTMRRKTFLIGERAALIPVELVSVLKPLLLILPILALLAGFGTSGSYSNAVFELGGRAAIAILGGVFAGAIITPLLLPWLPGRAFSIKGLIAGLAVEIPLWALLWGRENSLPTTLEALGWITAGIALATFLAMNFTGASTYTSLSGVRREMRTAVPLQVAGAAFAFVAIIVSRVIS